MKKFLFIAMVQLSALVALSQLSISNTKWLAHFEIPRSADMIMEFKNDTLIISHTTGQVVSSYYFRQRNDSLFVRTIKSFAPCPEGAEGWYQIEWRENGQKFIFHVLNDNCKPRSNAWTGMRILEKIKSQ